MIRDDDPADDVPTAEDLAVELGRYRSEVRLDTPQRRELYSLMRGPAYFDDRHPEHAEAVARAKQLFEGDD